MSGRACCALRSCPTSSTWLVLGLLLASVVTGGITVALLPWFRIGAPLWISAPIVLLCSAFIGVESTRQRRAKPDVVMAQPGRLQWLSREVLVREVPLTSVASVRDWSPRPWSLGPLVDTLRDVAAGRDPVGRMRLVAGSRDLVRIDLHSGDWFVASLPAAALHFAGLEPADPVAQPAQRAESAVAAPGPERYEERPHLDRWFQAFQWLGILTGLMCIGVAVASVWFGRLYMVAVVVMWLFLARDAIRNRGAPIYRISAAGLEVLSSKSAVIDRGTLTRARRVSRLAQLLGRLRPWRDPWATPTTTRWGNAIRLEAGRRRLLITPNDPEAFVARLGHLWAETVPPEARRLT